jgi:hypothetical protein
MRMERRRIIRYHYANLTMNVRDIFYACICKEKMLVINSVLADHANLGISVMIDFEIGNQEKANLLITCLGSILSRLV